MRPQTITALATTGALLLVFIYYKWKDYRLQQAEKLHAIDKIDFSSITEEDHLEYPDRPKGIVLLIAGIASLIGFFIFFSTQQKSGFINSNESTPTPSP